MNKLVQSAVSGEKFTANGALTLATSFNKNLDLFSVIGSSRNDPSVALEKFKLAFNEDQSTAIRILLWARDARGGAGERDIFRKIMAWLAVESKRSTVSIMLSGKIEELGRFDDYVDLLVNENIIKPLREQIAQRLRYSIESASDVAGLVAKWLPRKGKESAIIRQLMGLTPKAYRKMLVEATNVVESKMCAKTWEDINFSHVPSVAMARYSKAFGKNSTEAFVQYKKDLEEGKVEAKASVLYPYDVLRTAESGDAEIADAQWKALPDYLDGASKMLPMIDVSGSMTVPAGSKGSLSCMDVAVSLGIYLSQKQEGAFKNLAMTFESDPSWITIDKPTIAENISHVKSAPWGGSTDIQAAFELLLKTAVTNKVPASDMPEHIIIISDMEFNEAQGDYGFGQQRPKKKTNFAAIESKFEEAGYVRPNIIFWNVNARADNVQVVGDENKTSMISGFSAAIMKSIIRCEEITPMKIMYDAIGSARYDIMGLTKSDE
jgi:hypothetical protein